MEQQKERETPMHLHTELKSLPTPELLKRYNAVAMAAGLPTVKRFSDRKAAERRTGALLAEYEATAKQAKARASAPKKEKQNVDEDFGCREGTNRWNLLAALRAGRGSAVAQSALLKAVYGEAHKEYRAPLAMVMKGLQMAITAKKLPYVIEKSRENKELHFALKSKE
jgi:hypothetical protein